MITHTKAFATFKEQKQELMDFAVLVCYAVPSLKVQAQAVAAGIVGPTLPCPDYWPSDQRTTGQVVDLSKGYRDRLATYLLMSAFSFFEAYITGAIREVIDFHGGEPEFCGQAERRSREFIVFGQRQTATKALKRKLQEYEKSGKHLKYKKYSRMLIENGFRFPTDLLSAYGAHMLTRKAMGKNGIGANEIPHILRHGLQMNITAATETRFHVIRETRNQIAHGRPPSKLSLRQVLGTIAELTEIAVAVDAHIVEHFLVLEKYA